MNLFHRKRNLPAPLVDSLQKEMTEKDVNFLVKLLAEFSLFLLMRARKEKRLPTGGQTLIPFPERRMIHGGVKPEPPFRITEPGSKV